MQTVIEITEGAELPSEQNPASELADFAEQICGVADPPLESIAVKRPDRPPTRSTDPGGRSPQLEFVPPASLC